MITALATQPTQTSAFIYAAWYEALYEEVYYLAAEVDARLRAGYHLRDRRGGVIRTFDEWLRAAERGEWER